MQVSAGGIETTAPISPPGDRVTMPVLKARERYEGSQWMEGNRQPYAPR
jgi:hypothetical protein